MKKPTIITIITIIALLIIGVYVAGEVDYFSTKKIVSEYSSPVVKIDKIGVEEKINNESISKGVYHEPKSFAPTKGETILFGHRTLQGSPFLRLNELKRGDNIIIEWPGIGEVNYTVNNSKIVPASYLMNSSKDIQKIYLITCDPIGSTENRLIVECDLSSQGKLNDTTIESNPQQYTSLIILVIFSILGLAFAYFYPKDNRIYILATVLIIIGILIYLYFFPVPSELIYSKINWLNGNM